MLCFGGRAFLDETVLRATKKEQKPVQFDTLYSLYTLYTLYYSLYTLYLFTLFTLYMYRNMNSRLMRVPFAAMSPY